MQLTFVPAHNTDTLGLVEEAKMRYLIALIVTVAGSCGLGLASAGDIYCNNQGRDCSDRWTPGATTVRALTRPAGGNTETTPSEPQPAVPAAATAASAAPDSGADARLKDEARRLAVQKDVAASRAEQCKQAKDKYQKSVEARRVYRLNKAGEREYLSDAETEQARLNARLEMDRSCGPSTP
jgi:hypothetical protein